MLDLLLEQLGAFDVGTATAFFAVVNLCLFAASVIGCWALGRLFARRRLFDRWEPFSPVEGLATIVCIVINVAVSVVGWQLWTLGHITLTQDRSLGDVLLDTALMVMAMDLGMYVLHRVAHHPWLFRAFHSFHHRHEVTNPISLFVLHPFEVLGFGGLMIAFLWLYPMAPAALVAYLTLNLVFGTLGHSGVEPFPAALSRIPLLRLVGTSTFHAEHHEHPGTNFGFYTLVWDHLFGTLDPEYWQRYRTAVSGPSP
ncbi:MAG: sterol desaturase family protein [Acidobacteriota bacterium]